MAQDYRLKNTLFHEAVSAWGVVIPSIIGENGLLSSPAIWPRYVILPLAGGRSETQPPCPVSYGNLKSTEMRLVAVLKGKWPVSHLPLEFEATYFLLSSTDASRRIWSAWPQGPGCEYCEPSPCSAAIRCFYQR
jgi:hypothetical protein